MFCPTCGTSAEEGTRFCRSCGADLAAYQAGRDRLAARVQKAAAPAASAPAAQPAPAARPEHAVSAATASPAAAPAPAPQRTSAASKVLVGVAAVCVAAAVGVGIWLFGPGSGASGEGAEPAAVQPAETAATAVDGVEVRALERPTLLASLAVDEPAVTPAAPDAAVEPGLANVVNAGDFYLSDEVAALVAANGFAVEAGWGYDEFFDGYEMNRYLVDASFVTVDSMMHTYHLYFQHLQKNTERAHLAPQLLELSNAMTAASAAQLEALAGTEWEAAAARNTAFFAVGARLQDDTAAVPAAVADEVDAQLALIAEAAQVVQSPLFEGEYVDYSQYIVRGYYEGDPQLERYFRAMMWYGQGHFKRLQEDLDRSALLMTLALHDSGALEQWEAIYAVTSFFAGASDDLGYCEYYPLACAVYGDGVTAAALPGDDGAWEQFHALTATLRAPQVNSAIVDDDGTTGGHEDENKGLRFMGQRFTIDAAIMQKLVYSDVGANAAGDKRMLPNALDVPAALGSDEALGILEAQGETSYDGYAENMAALRATYADDEAPLWSASLYSQWLHTLSPLLAEHGAGYPAFMQSSAWTRKNLQTYLGSYTELKHDTVLYAKQPLVEMGGMIPEKDDRGYVEAEPGVFARLEGLVAATREGLAGFGMLDGADEQNLRLLEQLAGDLKTIAAKELRGETPSSDEFELIRSYGGQLEHFWEEVYKDEPREDEYLTSKAFPAAVVVDVATDPNGQVLELGTGKVNPIYVAVPIDGQLHLARGFVYSFYQFGWPLSDRLTDSTWRQMVRDSDAGAGAHLELEAWTRDFQYDRTAAQ